MAVPTVNATAMSILSSAPSISASITTTQPNTILVASAFAGTLDDAPPFGLLNCVVSSSPALTWTRRSRTPVGDNLSTYLDIWWALAPTARAYSVTAAYSTNIFDDAALTVVAMLGCNLTAPFDVSSALPAIISSTVIATPTHIVSTGQAEAYLLWNVFDNYNQIANQPAGWTALRSPQNNGGKRYAWGITAGRSYSAQLNNTTLFWGSGVGIIDDGTVGRWASVIDALVPPAAPPVVLPSSAQVLHLA